MNRNLLRTLLMVIGFLAPLAGWTQIDQMAIPPHTAEFCCAGVRGYHFRAPLNFTITGLRVPNDYPQGSLPQSVAIVRFNNGAPPSYPVTTNDFVQLARVVSQGGYNIIPVCIPVQAGEWIGVYGDREGHVSYGVPQYATHIFGWQTTLYRSGMNFSLQQNNMQEIWAQDDKVGRIELFYTGSSPDQPTPITGSTDVCANELKVYQVSPVSNVVYQWTGLPDSARIISGQGTNQITVNWGNTPQGNYTLKVRACRTECQSCSPDQMLAVTLRRIPQVNESMIGTDISCKDDIHDYEFPNPIPQGVFYNWSIDPPSAGTFINGNTGLQVGVRWDMVGSAQLKMTPSGACGDGTTVSKSVQVLVRPPLTPSVITGDTVICPAPRPLSVYLVNQEPGVSYFWTGLPPTATLVSGQNTNRITVNWGNTAPGAYQLSVTPSSICGSGVPKTIRIWVKNIPVQPAHIFGNMTVCITPGVYFYNVTASPNTQYQWQIGCSPVTITPLTQAGDRVRIDFTRIETPVPFACMLKVRAVNECGVSEEKTLNLNVIGSPTIPGPIQGGNIVCQGQEACYFTAPSPQASSYVWRVTPGGGHSFNTPNGRTNVCLQWLLAGTYTLSVQGVNSCGQSETRTMTVVVHPTPQVPVLNRTTDPVCPGQMNAIYSVYGQQGQNLTYNWTLPPQASLVSGQGTNTVLVHWNQNALPGTYNITVQPYNGACPGGTLTISVWVANNIAPTPNNLRGITQICGDTTVTYEADSVAGAVSYLWEGIPPNAWIVDGANTTRVRVRFQNVMPGSYVLSIKAVNDCGISPPATITVNVLRKPDNPVFINVPSVYCQGQNVVLEVANDRNASSYQWSTDCGWTILPNGNRAILNVGGNTLSCNVSVKAVNACGISESVTLPVTSQTVPRLTNPILGVTVVCPNRVETYRVTTLPNVTYNWSGIPNGAFIVSGQGTPNLTINWGTAPVGQYQISVIPSNACGNGLPQTLRVEMRGTITELSPINGLSSVCKGATATYSMTPMPGVIYSWSVSPAVSGLPITGSSVNIHWTQTGTYMLTVTPNNVCGAGTPRTLTVQVTNQIQADAGPDQTICTNSAVINGNPSGGVWTCVVCTGGTQLVSQNGNAFLTNIGSGIQKLRYTVSSGGNCDPSFDEVEIENAQVPSPTLAPSQTFCGLGNGTLTLSGVGQGVRVIRWERSVNDFQTVTTINNTLGQYTFSNLTVNTQFRAVVNYQNRVCPDAYSNAVLINIVADVQPIALNPTVNTCNSSAIVNVIESGGQGSWSFVSGPVSANIVTSGTIGIISGMTAEGTYIFRRTVNLPPCPARSVDVTVNRVIPAPQANAGSNQLICASSVVLTGNNPGTGTARWVQVSGPANVTLTGTPPTVTASGLNLAGNYVFEYQIEQPICNIRSNSRVTVERKASPSRQDFVPLQVCSSSVSVTANVPNVGSGRWAFQSGVAVPSWTTNGLTLNIDNLPVNGDYFFAWIASNPPCADEVSIQKITRLGNNGQASVNQNNIEVCGSSVTLTAVPPDQGLTGSWSVVSGSANIQTLGNNGWVTGMNAPGTYVFRWTVSGGACGNTFADVTVKRNADIIPLPNAGNNQLLCNQGSALLMGNAPPLGVTGRWRLVSAPQGTPPSLLQTGNNLIVTNMIAAGTYVFAWEFISGNCPPASSQVTVTRVLPPTPANILPVSDVCGTSFTVTGNTPINGSGRWVLAQMPGGNPRIIPSGNSATVADATIPGVYVVRYIIENPPCTPSTAEVSVNVNSGGKAGTLASNVTEVCTGTNTGTLTLSGHEGNIIRWERSLNGINGWTIINNTLNRFTFTNLTQSVSYRVVVKQGNCPELISNSVRITVAPRPAQADAGPDQTICANNITLTGSNPTPLTGRWEFLAGPMTPNLNPTGNNAVVITGMNFWGNYTFRYSILSAVCGNSSDEVVITVSEATFGGTLTANATHCQINNSGTLNLSGQRGNVIRWERSLDNFVNNITTIDNQSTRYPYQNLTQTTHFRTVVKSGACAEQNSNAVRILILNLTPADAGPDQNICSNQTTLTGNVPQAGNGSWAFVNGPVTPVITGSGNAVAVSGLNQTGVYTFEYRINNSGCTPSADQMTVTVSGNSVGGTLTASPVTICSGQTTRLRLNGQTGNVVRWESSTNNWVSTQTILSTLTDFTTNALSLTTRFRAIVKNGACAETLSNEIIVIVEDANFSADAGLDRTVCADSVVLVGNVPPSGTPSWRFLSGPNSPTVTGNGVQGLAKNLVAGTYIFEYSVNRAGCGITRDEVRIQVAEKPKGVLSSADTVYCGTSDKGTIRLMNYSGVIVRWESSENNFDSYNQIGETSDRLTFNNLSRTTSFRVLLKTVGCDSFYTLPIKIRIASPPSNADAGADQIICGTQVTLTGNVPQSGTPVWSLMDAPNNANPLLIPDGSNLNVSNLIEGNYTFIYSIQNAPCPAKNDTVNIQVYPPSVGGMITPNPASVCGGINQGTITLNQFSGKILRWEISTDQTNWQIVNDTIANPAYQNLAQTTFFRAVVKNNNCPESYSNTVAVVVMPVPDGGRITGGGTFCQQNLSGTLNLIDFMGNVVRWERSFDGFITDVQPIANTSTQLIFSNLTQKTYFRAVISSGTCGTVYSEPAVVDLVSETNAGTLSQDVTVCSGENSGLLTLTGASGNVIRWESSTDNFQTANVINHTATTFSFTNLSQTTAYRVVVQNGGCPSATSNSVTVTVRAGSIGGTLNGSTSVCSGQNQGALVLTGQTGNVIRWEKSTDGGASWITVANTTTLYNYQNLTQTVQYRVAVKNNDCPERFSSVAIVTVDLPSIGGTVSGSQTVCTPTGNVTLSLSGQRGAVLFWEVSTNNCLTFTQTIASTQTAITLSNLSQTTCYRAKVKNGACSVENSSTATVTVRPLPVSGTLRGDTLVCQTNPTGTLNISGQNAPVIRWERLEEGGGGDWVRINHTASNYTFPAINTTTRFRVWMKYPECSDSIAAEVKVRTVEPTQAGFLFGHQTLCFGQNAGILSLQSQVGNIVRWEYSQDSAVWVGINHLLPQLNIQNLTQTTFYRVLVRSGNCEPAFSNIVKVTITQELQLNVGRVTGCNGKSNVQALAVGGTPPYTYSIMPLVHPSNNTGTFFNLTAGGYTINVSDANGCADTFFITLGSNQTPTQILEVANVTQSTALVRWVEVPPGAGVTYNLRYRIVNEPTWTIISGITGTTRFVTNLQNNTSYEVEVQYVCPGGSFSPFSSELVHTFTTLSTGTGDCETSQPTNVPVPGGIYISQITPTTAVVNWNLVTNARGYIVSYGNANDNPNTWQQVIVCDPSRSLQLNNLNPNTPYRVRLRTNCSNCTTALDNGDKRSAWTTLYGFTTPSSRESEILPEGSNLNISLYPNPTRSIIHLTGITAPTRYEWTDALGRTLAKGILVPEKPNLDLSHLAGGVYVLKLWTAGTIVPLKVVKE